MSSKQWEAENGGLHNDNTDSRGAVVDGDHPWSLDAPWAHRTSRACLELHELGARRSLRGLFQSGADRGVDGCDHPSRSAELMPAKRDGETGRLRAHYSARRDELERNPSIQQSRPFNVQFQMGARADLVLVGDQHAAAADIYDPAQPIEWMPTPHSSTTDSEFQRKANP